jgi:long-chain fatty acid transport protein
VKNMHKPLRTIVNAAVLGVLASGAVHATGFALYGESSGYTAGNYGAGVAAEAADASTGWYNPAGLALLHEKEVVFGGTGVFPDVKINGTSRFTTTGLPDYVQTYKNVNGSYSGFVPASHFALPVGERTTVGLSINGPFGLSTDWAPDSPVRYSATYTELLTVNISPEIGTQIFEHLALGAGMDFQYSRVKFNQMLGVPTLLQAFDEDPYMGDSFSKNKGASWGLGFHVGVMGLFNENHTRIGLNYQSKVRQVFYGHSELKGPLANDFNLAGAFPSTGVWKNGNLFSNPITFPDVVTLSGYQDINDKFAVLGSVVYSGWHVFKSIQLNNVPVPNISSTPPFAVTQANVITTVPQNYKDAWRVALGANYRINTQWMLRVGGGYDQTPSNNVDRNTRLPDADRWAIAVGAHYQWKPNLGFDLGYTHLFSASPPSITSSQPLSATSTYFVDSHSGHFSADLVGGQVVWVIDKAEPAAPMK